MTAETNETWPYAWEEATWFLSWYLPGLLVCSLLVWFIARSDTRAPLDRKGSEGFFIGAGLVLWPITLISLTLVGIPAGIGYLVTKPNPNATCNSCQHKMSEHRDDKCPIREAP